MKSVGRLLHDDRVGSRSVTSEVASVSGCQVVQPPRGRRVAWHGCLTPSIGAVAMIVAVAIAWQSRESLLGAIVEQTGAEWAVESLGDHGSERSIDLLLDQGTESGMLAVIKIADRHSVGPELFAEHLERSIEQGADEHWMQVLACVDFLVASYAQKSSGASFAGCVDTLSVLSASDRVPFERWRSFRSLIIEWLSWLSGQSMGASTQTIRSMLAKINQHQSWWSDLEILWERRLNHDVPRWPTNPFQIRRVVAGS